LLVHCNIVEHAISSNQKEKPTAQKALRSITHPFTCATSNHHGGAEQCAMSYASDVVFSENGRTQAASVTKTGPATNLTEIQDASELHSVFESQGDEMQRRLACGTDLSLRLPWGKEGLIRLLWYQNKVSSRSSGRRRATGYGAPK